MLTPLIGPSPQANPGDADILISWFSADDRLSYYMSVVMSIKITMIPEVVDRNPGRMSMDDSQESQDHKITNRKIASRKSTFNESRCRCRHDSEGGRTKGETGGTDISENLAYVITYVHQSWEVNRL
jgi:hypothetical protein